MSYQPVSAYSSAPSPLSSSVSSLQSSLTLLSSSISILDAGTKDLPRLSKTLTQTRHFELTPAFKLTQAQESLASELAPAIDKLLGRVEAECERMERREEGLRARGELLGGRLESGGDKTAQVGAPRKFTTATTAKFGGGGGEKALRLKMLKQKKERLNYAVERLTLQSQQRQRQLRMSVNVPRLEEED